MQRMLKRVGDIIGHPARTFAEVGPERLQQSALYLLALLLADALLLMAGSAVVWPLLIAPYFGDQQAVGWLGVALVAPLVVAMGLGSLALGGLILHPFVLLAGGRQGVAQTLKAVFYAATPALLSLWLPPLLLVGIVWTVVLAAVGLRHLQGVSAARAALAVVLPLALLGALGYLL